MKNLYVVAACIVVCLVIIFQLPVDIGGLI